MKLDGVESATAWDLWGKSLALQEKIEENRQEMHHLLLNLHISQIRVS